jgi:hypothetical protein
MEEKLASIILSLALQLFFPIFGSTPGEYVGLSVVNTAERIVILSGVSVLQSVGEFNETAELGYIAAKIGKT